MIICRPWVATKPDMEDMIHSGLIEITIKKMAIQDKQHDHNWSNLMLKKQTRQGR